MGTVDQNVIKVGHYKRRFGDINGSQRLHSETLDIFCQESSTYIRKEDKLRDNQECSEIVHNQRLLWNQSPVITQAHKATPEMKTINLPKTFWR